MSVSSIEITLSDGTCQRHSDTALPSSLERDYHCDALNLILSQHSSRTRRAINRMLAPLSPAEDMAACEALCFFALQDRPSAVNTVSGPNSIVERVLYRFAKNFTMVRRAEIITMLTPMYLDLSESQLSLDTALMLAIKTDHSNVYTSSGHWATRTFPRRRVNVLYGSMMASAAPDLAIRREHVEWFGSRRAMIFPIWDHLVKEGTFDPDRIEVLIQEANHVPLTLIEGAL